MHLTPVVSAAMPPALVERLEDVLGVLHNIDCTAHITLGVVRYGDPWAGMFTDDTSRALNEVERSSGGPAVDALWCGRIARIDSTLTEVRWPEYVQTCQQHGVSSVIACPVLGQGARVGVISVASHDQFAFGPQETRIAVRAATRVSYVLDA